MNRLKFKIPKSFYLLGHKYEIEMVNNLFETENCYGEADPVKKKIRLQTTGMVTRNSKHEGKNDSDIVEITEDDLVETFFHEMIHIILNSIGHEKLYKNEQFVSVLGRCLLEIEKTKEFDCDEIINE